MLLASRIQSLCAPSLLEPQAGMDSWLEQDSKDMFVTSSCE